MAEKRVRTTFDKVRLALRIIGIVCALIPIIGYLVFAAAFNSIQVVTDYENLTRTVVDDWAYQLTAFTLPIANFGWTYLFPIFFPIAIFDIIVAVRRQMSNRLY